ncbi:fumarylacetoacetate hydrolase family protein [uncultured Maribacter sp.]|uniref:fumarylacetoacetate hydrolase family protein n=1 Tax=uncultured Maribacter sp. TaxID=431308 RepID=UPI0026218942|nr:fumarylacetoacetate hydrolase family protein [uncultured Maribacter sp.]
MKIIGIGKNYVSDLSEMPKGKVIPLIFTKPDSSLLENNADLELPAFSDDVWYEVELAFRIGKTCKNATLEDALLFVDAIALANDLTAKDVLKQSREPNKGPWALAKGFDGATPISKFLPISDFSDVKNINFSMTVNGIETQKGNSSLMITTLAELIVYVSNVMTLNSGDILLSGTPALGADKVNSGDEMLGYLEGEKMFHTKVK